MEQSERFYLALLGPLGFAAADSAPGEYTRLTNGRDAVLVLLPHRGRAPTHSHRHGLGLNHLAFQAPSRRVVDEVSDAMAALGHRPLGDGKTDTGYRGPYYTVSYLDPDGVMVEVVFHREGYFSKDCDDLFPGG
jgi:catechol 2,3-dioxygenase-like lactoylglutathione lyase family enzyme